MRKNHNTKLSLLMTTAKECIGQHLVCDDIDKLILGMEALFANKPLLNQIIELLKNTLKLPEYTGRPGMDYWTLFVLATLRVTIDCDYSRLHNLVNNHRTLRLALGYDDLDWRERHALSTIKENVTLLTAEVLLEINTFIATYGRAQVHPYSQDNKINARCDSFVAKTDVHYPTDINQLQDALRKVLELSGQGLKNIGIQGLRQYKNQLKKLKKLYNKARNSKKHKSEDAMKQAHQDYILAAQECLASIYAKLDDLAEQKIVLTSSKAIEYYHACGMTLIDQIDRRVLKGETIPHDEKMFSLFESHTEWIVKGKSGVPFELGVKVAIVQDQHQFILHHHVMEKQQDASITVEIAKAVQEKYGAIDSMSYDRGFWSAANEEDLGGFVRKVVLPKKGYLSQARQAIESEKEHVALKFKHSAVESGINELQVHGLRKVPDSGLAGYKRYIALGVIGFNIHKLGGILLDRHYKKNRKKAA